MSTAQSTTILEKIRQRGHWFVVIRPGTFEEKRVEYEDLFAIIERNSVRFRGWDYPHVGSGRLSHRGHDWIEQDYDQDDAIEVWRFHTNGLFVHSFAMTGEWRDQSALWPPDPGRHAGRSVYYLDAIFSFVEIFEFGARLAQSMAGGTTMRVELEIKDLRGRRLVAGGRHFRSFDNFTFEPNEWGHRWDGPQAELIAHPRELAAQAARKFFDRAGLVVSLETLGLLQEQIRH